MVEAGKECEVCNELKMTTSKQVILVEGVPVVKWICIGCEEQMRTDPDNS